MIELNLPKKPLLQIDRILRKDVNKVETIKCISEGDYFIQGHFRERSIFPGFLLYESIIQGLSILLSIPYHRLKLLKASTRFLSIVVPGDRVHFFITKTKEENNYFHIKAEGLVDSRKVIFFKAVIGIE